MKKYRLMLKKGNEIPCQDIQEFNAENWSYATSVAKKKALEAGKRVVLLAEVG